MLDKKLTEVKDEEICGRLEELEQELFKLVSHRENLKIDAYRFFRGHALMAVREIDSAKRELENLMESKLAEEQTI